MNRYFGVSAKGASEVVKAVRSAYKKTLIVKLSPNVTDITEIARAAEESGADSVSLINTLLGMAIDAERKRPIKFEVGQIHRYRNRKGCAGKRRNDVRIH